MANLQIRLDDALKERACAVASGMGMELSSAVRIFLAQMVKENGFPFRPSNDPFYCLENQEALRASIKELQNGHFVTKTLDELRSIE